MGETREVLSRPWPFAGRHEERDEIVSSLSDRRAIAVIVGRAGTGKTRLAREVLRHLEADGWVTATAIATASAEALPLGALAHLVPAGAAESPPQLFARTQDALAARGSGRPVVVHLDDAHHLDATSATLLVSLSEADAVRLVLTVRSGVPVPPGVAALQAAEGARTTTLGPLDDLATDTLLHRVLGGPLDGMAVNQLTAISGGNPLFLREVVLDAVGDGTLQEVAGVWRLTADLSVGGSLGERVLGRMAGLPAPARDILDLLAVAEPVGLASLEATVDGQALELLERQELIRIELDGRREQVRLAHPVHAEVLRSALGRVRLRRLSREQADRIVAAGARRAEDAIRIVELQLQAGLAPDVEVAMTGARMARHHRDWSATARLSGAARAAGHADAAALLAEAHVALGDFDDASAVARRALEDPSGLSEAAYVALHRTRSDTLFFGEGDSAGAISAMEQAMAEVADPTLREMLLFARAAMLVWAGRVEQAVDGVDDLMASAEPRVAVQAAMIAEVAAATCGPAGRAVELADHWYPVHAALPDLEGTNSPGFHLVIKTVALTNAGRLADASALAELGYRASVAGRDLVGQLWFALELGRAALLQGDAAAARRWFREQVALCRSTGWRRPVTLGLSGLAVAEAHLGDAEAAARAVAERDASPLPVIELFAVEAARGAAWALAARGDRAGARRALVAGAEAAEADGIVLMAALARIDALRLGDRDQGPALARAAATVDSDLVRLASRWAAAPSDGEELEQVATGFEEMGAMLHAAEAAAAAAEAWRRAGRSRQATSSARRAEHLARRCAGAAPTLVTVSSDVPLTAREREVVLLVAEGLPTKEVAARLFLSARTVSNHLQNAYTKLGITRRTEIASALTRLGSASEVPA